MPPLNFNHGENICPKTTEEPIINIASGVAYRIKDVIEKIREIVGSACENFGMLCGWRDHSTVIQACKIIEDKRRNISSFNKLIKEYKKDLKKYSIS